MATLTVRQSGTPESGRRREARLREVCEGRPADRVTPGPSGRPHPDVVRSVRRRRLRRSSETCESR